MSPSRSPELSENSNPFLSQGALFNGGNLKRVSFRGYAMFFTDLQQTTEITHCHRTFTFKFSPFHLRLWKKKKEKENPKFQLPIFN